MNKLIGITGGMASGKTTLSKELLKLNPKFIYIDVDDFRTSLYNNENYVYELKEKILELNKYEKIDSLVLNKYIYNDKKAMTSYKKLLYRYLYNYINTFKNKTIIIDWALIVKDNLVDKFDKIIYLDIDDKTRLERLSNSDLSKEEILTRFKLQQIDNIDSYSSNKFMIARSDNMSIEKINDFINSMECKFTLPNDEGKAIWEITHNCNYGCSYCIFSCGKKKVDGELSKEECFHVIDELIKNGFKHLKITGGEPFLRKDIIDILKYASSKMTVDISTNASLINDKIVSKLNELDLKMIHVSLDGNKEEHESVRGTLTYERTIKGLEALKNSKNRVRIGTVIHINNQNNLENLIIDSIKYETNEIIFSIMEPTYNQSKELVKTISNDKLMEKLNILKNKYKDKIIVNYNFGKQPNYVKRCPAGDKFLYINNLGFISPCPWVYENNRNCISKISLRDSSLKSILKDKTICMFLSNKEKGQCYGKI